MIEKQITERPWHAISPEETLSTFEVEREGLSDEEAQQRRELFGENRLPEEKPPGLFQILLRQFRDPLIYILLVAMIVSLVIQHWNDAIFIFAVLALNATIGTIQEWKAQLSVQGLKEVIEEKATVSRSGHRREIPSIELVPGDIVHLKSGRRVPADIRLVSSRNLRADESLLTGESMPVDKSAEASVDNEAGVGDRRNMLHAGSVVLDGRAEGVVCRTGAASEIGRIAESLTGEAGDPPLVVKMRRFTRHIAIFVLFAVAAVAGGQIAVGTGWAETLLLAVALAVSAIPAGLPVAVTVALSVASHRMAKRNVIVRRLPAVEGLGSCTTIASDKTGTLTENKLTVKTILLSEGARLRVEGEGYTPEGELLRDDGSPAEPEQVEQVRELARSGALCNEAEFSTANGQPEISGDTVDVAFLVLAAKLGDAREELNKRFSPVGNIPFESQRKFAAFFYQKDGEFTVHVKGAAERVLPMCGDVDADAMAKAEDTLADQGFRVLAVASGPVDRKAAESGDEQALQGLAFRGLVGLIDPVRSEVPDAVDLCHKAGVKVLMVTGDHPATARSIGRQIGLLNGNGSVMTGRELDQLQDSREREERIRRTRVFARFEPTQKIQLVETLQRHGEFVAVTGDGVNDAPALKTAHISVAMGKGGTDIARRVAELILTDDNFASIVNGIEEGRIAFDNVRKVVWLLISTGVAEVVLFLAALVSGMPLPLFAVQLLWLNLVTNGIQDVALAFEQKEPGVMKRPPRPPKQPMFDRRMIEQVALSGLVVGGIGYAVFYFLLKPMGLPETEARNLLLLLMVLFENMHIFNCRSEHRSAFRVPIRANYLLIGTVVLAQAIHIGAMYLPGLSDVLHIHPVTITQWGTLLGVAFTVILVVELYKWLRPEPNDS